MALDTLDALAFFIVWSFGVSIVVILANEVVRWAVRDPGGFAVVVGLTTIGSAVTWAIVHLTGGR